MGQISWEEPSRLQAYSDICSYLNGLVSTLSYYPLTSRGFFTVSFASENPTQRAHRVSWTAGLKALLVKVSIYISSLTLGSTAASVQRDGVYETNLLMFTLIRYHPVLHSDFPCLLFFVAV